MRRQPPLFPLVAALFAVAGALLIGDFLPKPSNLGPVPAEPIGMTAIRPVSPRSEAPPEPLSPSSPSPRVVARSEAAARFPRRDAREVFNGGQPAQGWRDHHPLTVRIAPSPGVFLTFNQVQANEEGRHLTWVGRNPAMPGATLVGVATSDGYDAIMMLPGVGQYNFHVRGERVLVEEVIASGRDCELGSTGVAAPFSPAVPPAALYAEAGEAKGTAPPMLESAALVEGLPRVDVLFLYNTRALAVAAERSNDPVGYIDGYARAGLETCNQVLVNSRVDNFSWRYVRLVAAPEYPEKQTVSEDLAMIGPEGPFAAFVSSARTEYGADQVLMWVGSGFRQGSAYVGDPRSAPVSVDYAVAGLRLTAGILILAHELAHNFGCHHDRGHAGTGDGSTATPDGDGLWCYGLLWNDPGAATTSGTVMAYADFLVPYFSNPAITLNITSTLENRPGPFLELGTRAIGFPETDPRAANNARILQEHAAHMAALSEETEATPVILQQPRDTTLAADQILALSVSAVGGGLTYQWLKDEVAIAGAVQASFGKTFAAADAGNYRVRITNRRGTVTSRAAVVTLAAAILPPVPPPPVTPAASATGGGGGGAPSLGFYAALLLVVGLRFRRGFRM